MKSGFVLLALLISLPAMAQQRIASDFELEQIRREMSSARDPLSRIAAHLNLGDVFASRSDHSAAAREYAEAIRLASSERLAARRTSDLTRYARLTSYQALATARSGDVAAAFDLFEESIRYLADSDSHWNRYASGMLVAGRNDKAAAAARNALRIIERSTAPPSIGHDLDRGIYRYTLASALASDASGYEEAIELLRANLTVLESDRFNAMRRDLAAAERFETVSTIRDQRGAYLSLLSRSRLRLATLLEQSGRTGEAIQMYRAALAQRTDDPVALAGLARLATSTEQPKYFIDSFDANPFSPSLIRSYQQYLADNPPIGGNPTSAGQRLRLALEQIDAGRFFDARGSIEPMLSADPTNETLLAIAARTDRALGDSDRAAEKELRIRSAAARELARSDGAADPLRSRIAGADGALTLSGNEIASLLRFAGRDDLSPAERSKLDQTVFRVPARLHDAEARNGTTTASGARAGALILRFNSPVTFQGEFLPREPVMLDFRMIGVTRGDDSEETLLVEPSRVVRP